MSAPESINWIMLVLFLVGLAHELWARGSEQECRRRATRWAVRVDVLAAQKTVERASREHWEERFGLQEHRQEQKEVARELD